MSLYNKLKWILGILIVFVLIVATNLIDKNNFIRVRDSVVTIYEDRLIAKDLIFEMLKLVQQKEVAVLLSDSDFFVDENAKVNNEMQSLVSRFEKTKLTAEEEIIFNDLKKNIQSVLDAESQITNSDYGGNSEIMGHIASIKDDLDDLSEIQLDEGRRQMSISQRAVDAVELFTQLEIYLLVFLAIVIQIIVMYNPKAKP